MRQKRTLISSDILIDDFDLNWEALSAVSKIIPSKSSSLVVTFDKGKHLKIWTFASENLR